MTLSERQNAAYILEYTTARPFYYCRYYYKCFFCHEQFNELNTLLKHTLEHTVPEHDVIMKALLPKGKRTVKVDISELKCKKCNKSFVDLKDIRAHLDIDHKIKFTESENGIVAYNLKLIGGQYSCHMCNKIFQTFILLNRHMNVHYNNAVCETCGAGFMTHQRLMQHKEIHLPGGYPCKKCDKVYTTNSNLKFHMDKVHNGLLKSRMLRCPHCLERFTEHFRKLKHLKEVHGITFTFDCEVCKSVFSSRRALTMHSNKFHSEKTRCTVCRKCFGCITTLKKHMVCHTGERNHLCHLCRKAYRHQKSLKHHMGTHVQVGKTFECLECVHRFTNRIEYDNHIKEWHPQSFFSLAVN